MILLPSSRIVGIRGCESDNSANDLCRQDLHRWLDVLWTGGYSLWLRLLCADHYPDLRLQLYVLALTILDNSAVANVLPAVKTQLYSIPPWAASFGFSMLIAYLSDKFRHRFLFTIIPMLVAMAGFGILLNIHDTAQYHVQYGALFLVTSGCYSAMPVLVCWFAMNLGGHRRRSIGTAWQIGFGNSK